jgi:hypothetical protein
MIRQNVRGGSATKVAPQLPALWYFWWMCWMQPVLLRQKLLECGINEPGASALRLWRIDDAYRAVRRQYVVRLVAMLILGTPLISFAIAGILDACGITIDYLGVAYAVAGGIAYGLAGAAYRSASGVTVGVAVGVTVGVAYAVAVGVMGSGARGEVVGFFFVLAVVSIPVMVGVASGAGLGVSHGVPVGVMYGIASVVGIGVAWGVGWGVHWGVHWGVGFGVAWGVGSGVGVGVAFGIGFLRLLILPLDVVATLATRLLANVFGGSPLKFSPVNWRDLCYFPLPGLRQQMLDEASRDRTQVRHTLEACQRSPGQYKIGEVVLAILKAREWKQLVQDRDFAKASELRGEWLGGEEEPDARLQSLAEATRYLRAASIAVVARHRQQQVEQAREKLQSLGTLILTDRSKEAPEYLSALKAAASVADDML